jgi:hypothetical protein
MVDNALRVKWTDSNLDTLNSEVARRLQALDHGIRRIRTDIAELTAEVDRDVDELNGVRHSKGSRRSFEWQCPEPDVRVSWGEVWSDERVDDLCLEVREAVSVVDGELDGLQGEIEVSRSDLTARFDALARYRLRRLAAGRSPAPQRCRGRTRAGVVAMRPRGPWSDGRLDDLNHSFGLALVRLECGMEELRGEVTALRKEMEKRRRAHLEARSRLQAWSIYLFAAMMCVVAILNVALRAD